ncbi:hypothetical protein Fcan01_17549 [Folsomia candida]|uniref:Uncharacterized protein n=1 Tax=Folsomia candida TaxID=158441 RepID=A0A226DQ84_FOLCA|nr:hypothetical protein Fcan01_17549 [Folsomia candida]
MLQIVTLSISPVILADKIVPIFCTLLYATAVSFSAEWSADQGNIQLMNVITSDNDQPNSSKNTGIFLLPNILFTVMEVTYLILVVVGVMVFLSPCQLPFLGSLILPTTQCNLPIWHCHPCFAIVRIFLATLELI